VARPDGNLDPDGKVTSLVLHQGKRDTSMTRLDDASAKKVFDEIAANDALAAKRFAEQKPAAGSEATIRKVIAEIEAGTPNYDSMNPGLAAATRQQLPRLKAIFANLGRLKSVTFRSVEKSGMDVYVVEFQHGRTEWRIMKSPDGKIDTLGFQPM
jgi:hypothetical protein